VSHLCEVEHELLQWGSDPHNLSARADYVVQRLATEQRVIYDEILFAITNEHPLLMFVDGKAGCGKTFMINVICNKVRALGKIILLTATAAFAAQLYPGGRTTHSAFKVKVIGLSQNLAMLTFCIEVPVNDKNEMLRLPITYDDARGELI
jgi:RecG-like helicase